MPMKIKKNICGKKSAVQYIDLESGADRPKFTDPELYLVRDKDRQFNLDEAHRLACLFQSLHGLIEPGADWMQGTAG
jgi:hypothetical protein